MYISSSLIDGTRYFLKTGAGMDSPLALLPPPLTFSNIFGGSISSYHGEISNNPAYIGAGLIGSWATVVLYGVVCAQVQLDGAQFFRAAHRH